MRRNVICGIAFFFDINCYFLSKGRIDYIMKNISFSKNYSTFKYRALDSLRKNRKVAFFLILFSVIGLFTGIFAAIRYFNGFTIIDFNDFSVSAYLSGELGNSVLFYSRIFSTIAISIIIWISSISIFMLPVGLVIVIYRSYLLALNCTMIVLFNGLGGIISSLFIIFPCQIITMFLIILFVSYAFRYAYIKRRFGLCNEFKIWKKFIIFFVLILIVNLIETFLLFIFSSKVMLVI